MTVGSGIWLTTAEFAQLAEITRQKAHRALQRAFLGHLWRGTVLTVQLTHGRGGKRGSHYLVDSASLPPNLRTRHSQRNSSIGTLTPMQRRQGTRDIRAERAAIIAPAIAARLRGEPTKPILKKIAAELGKPTLETLERWLKNRIAGGHNGLLRKQRSDAHQPKVVISKRYDAFVLAGGMSKEKLLETAATLTKYVNTEWAKGVSSSRHVCRLASAFLFRFTRSLGIEISIADCEVPRHFVEREKEDFKRLAIRDLDARLYDDRYKQRIIRHRDNLVPMQWVACDVHHCDIRFARSDGSLATPKLIAWQDMATNVAHADLFFPGPRENVKQKHVIWSFMNLVHRFGMPSALYQDNGKEFDITCLADDALRCAALLGRELQIHGPVSSNKGGVTKAQPHQGQAKVIESLFSALERGPFAMISGYIGGDRMKKKTHNVGRELPPFPGTPEQLTTAILTAVEYYNSHKQTGRHLKGMSPNEAWNEFVRKGHTKIEADPAALKAMFSKEVSVAVDRGGFNVGGKRYRHDDLIQYSERRVDVLVPKYGRLDVIAVLDPKRHETGRYLLCFAELEQAFAFGDLDGAREQRRRNQISSDHDRRLRKMIGAVDLMEEMGNAIALSPARLEPAVGARLWIGEMAQDVADGMAALPPPGAPSRIEDDERDRNQEKMLEMFERSNASRAAKVSGA